ncbi:MAG: ABC transporter ATP-binding protein [Gammaproteobacteria bacterium HGW-Gammaproteobacteria-5]|nr:MAG: ABC transporter ATP-binding protein [Gammaproteobacteria bacterium HGW-Gammaproteobacteria-5]
MGGRVLLELDAAVNAGEVLTIMGPSGSGKSSLLAFVAGFLPPAFTATGTVRLAGQDITGLPAERSGVGLLFQDPLLFPHLSVAGNLRFGLKDHRADVDASIDEALQQIGLAGFARRDPATLSGGQKARVALMRLLLSKPRAVLLDEPFSKLDAGLRHEMRELAFGQLRASGLPTLLVTHDEADALDAGGPVIVL